MYQVHPTSFVAKKHQAQTIPSGIKPKILPPQKELTKLADRRRKVEEAADEIMRKKKLILF
jgi:hypothetical protein